MTTTTSPHQATALQRRTLLQWLGSSTALSSVALPAMAQTASSPQQELQDSWRALSRLGYGANPDLLRAVAASGSARNWAAQQIDQAYAASQRPATIATELSTFNLPLPQLYAAARAEREARQKRKANAADGKETEGGARRLDFSQANDPLYFSRTVTMQTAAWRMGASADPQLENPLLARMTEFWFNHLNVYIGKGAVRPFVGHYVVNVARAHALGKFEDLLLASARHPAMLLYLDQAQSVAPGTRGQGGRSSGLNENYARELMELHTLGVDGGYSQTDVRELARVLTGWTVAPQDNTGFRFAARTHDRGDKKLMGRTYASGLFRDGEQEGVDAIRMLARHPKTAQRVSLRLAQFLVSDQPPTELVQRMARTFLATQGDIRAVLREVVASAEFWNPDNRLFKTPMDYACSCLLATDAAQDKRQLLLAFGFLNNAGQPLHGWQTPDGYKFDAATWLVPEALTRRADFALTLARQTPSLDFLTPFLGDATRQTLAQEKPMLRAGLALASPEFQYK